MSKGREEGGKETREGNEREREVQVTLPHWCSRSLCSFFPPHLSFTFSFFTSPTFFFPLPNLISLSLSLSSQPHLSLFCLFPLPNLITLSSVSSLFPTSSLFLSLPSSQAHLSFCLLPFPKLISLHQACPTTIANAVPRADDAHPTGPLPSPIKQLHTQRGNVESSLQRASI